MRPIKFRAWDKDSKSMIHTFDGEYEILVNSEDGDIFCGGYMPNGDWNEPKLMQFTGLTDKNGKEIYEGDILKADRWFVHWVVQFDVVKARFNCIILNGESQNDYIPTDQVQVIGNIYENPELIK